MAYHLSVGTAMVSTLRMRAGRFARLPAARSRIAMLIAALLASTGSVPANAAAPDLTSLSLEQLLNVEVSGASKFPQKVSDAPSAVSIVTAKAIKAYGYRTLADILRSIRGLYISNDRNYTYVGARGFSRPGDYNSRVLLLVDGYRVNEAVYGGGLIETGFLIDVDMIERVEYVPGPGSAVYGSNAFFGVVNVVTKTGRELDRAEVSGEAGSFDSYKGRVSYGERFANGADLLISTSAYRSRGEDVYFPEYDDPATNNGIAEGLDHDRNRQALLKFSVGDFSVQTAYVTRTKAIPTAAYGEVFNDPRSETVDEQAYVDLRYAGRLRENLQVNASLHLGHYRYDGTYPILDALATTTVINTDVGRSGTWGGELRLLSTGFARHKLVFGGEYRHDYRQDQLNYDAEPNYVLYMDDKRDRHTFGLYLQDEFTVSEKWTFTGGLRYDAVDQETTEDVLNPRLAVIYKPDSKTTTKLLYGTAFRTPNVYEKYYVSDAGFYKQNPTLGPEKIRTVETVLERYMRDDLRFTGSLYYYRIDGLISLTQDPADGLLRFENLDQTEAKGAELEIERLWGEGRRLRASYSWQLATNSTTGRELTNSPRNLVKLHFATPLFRTGFTFGAEALYMSERDTPSGATVDDHTVVNVTLSSWEPIKNLELSASVYNLFDRAYGDPASEEHFDSLDRSLNEIPQSGRSYRLKLTYGF